MFKDRFFSGNLHSFRFVIGPHWISYLPLIKEAQIHMFLKFSNKIITQRMNARGCYGTQLLLWSLLIRIIRIHWWPIRRNAKSDCRQTQPSVLTMPFFSPAITYHLPPQAHHHHLIYLALKMRTLLFPLTISLRMQAFQTLLGERKDYAVFPMELVSRVAEKQAVQFISIRRRQCLSDVPRRGFNGYRHLIEPLKLLLKSPVVTHKGDHIVVEIINTIGPMCVFQLIRATRPEQIVRSIGLAENE